MARVLKQLWGCEVVSDARKFLLCFENVYLDRTTTLLSEFLQCDTFRCLVEFLGTDFLSTRAGTGKLFLDTTAEKDFTIPRAQLDQRETGKSLSLSSEDFKSFNHSGI